MTEHRQFTADIDRIVPARGAIYLSTPGERKSVSWSLPRARYSRRLCPALTYRFSEDDQVGGRLHAWAPVAPTREALGRFLAYCQLTGAALAKEMGAVIDAFVADPAGTLQAHGVSDGAPLHRVDWFLPAGYVALAGHLLDKGASASEMHEIHATLLETKNLSPANYIDWLDNHALELVEHPTASVRYEILNRLASRATRVERLEAACVAALRHYEDRDGDTVVSGKQMFRKAIEWTGATEDELRSLPALRTMSGAISGITITEPDVAGGATRGVYYRTRDKMASREQAMAAGLHSRRAQLTLSLKPIRANRGGPDDPVKAALAHVAQHRLAVMVGPAGTGKTYLARKVGELFEASGQNVAWTATTGRASRVLNDKSGKTLHSHLRVLPGALTHRCKEGVDLLIVDEASMMDAFLASPLGSYLASPEAPQRTLIVGDTHQLPPVGPGKVLLDIVHSADLVGATMTLSKIMRTDHAGILAVATAIRERKDLPDISALAGISKVPVDDTDAATAAIVGTVAGADWEGSLVIAPVYDGPLGISALNRALRDAHLGRSDADWLKGERVVQTKNVRIGEGDDAVIIANGTFGVVEKVDERDVTVIYEDGVVHTWGAAESASGGGVIESAYALSIHRAQGSQAPTVVVVADQRRPSSGWRDPAMGYTAVTRATERLVVVGNPELLRGVAGKGAHTRRTSLDERLGRLTGRIRKPLREKEDK